MKNQKSHTEKLFSYALLNELKTTLNLNSSLIREIK